MFLLAIFMQLFLSLECVMLRKECPHNEVHRSCAFREEYTCWEGPDKTNRVRSAPKRLAHCRSACYCKKGLVRSFPGGECINAANCRNKILHEVLKNTPTEFRSQTV